MAKITTDDFNRIIAEDLPLAHGLGLRLDAIERSRAVIRIPYDDAMYAVIMSELGTIKKAVTTNLNINFMRRLEPGDVIAEGRILKLGRRLAVMEVTIHGEGSDELVAHATGTYSIPPAAD